MRALALMFTLLGTMFLVALGGAATAKIVWALQHLVN